MSNDNEYELKRSKICCPKSGGHHMVRVNGKANDELLMMGYIRNLYKTVMFEDVEIMPDDIIKFAMKWCKTEMIHWIEFESPSSIDYQKNEKMHFAIPIQDIV